MSTDRPDMTESPYTVDAGHFQLELSVLDYTRDRGNDEGVTAESLAIMPMLLKAGLLPNLDLQLGLDPYTRQRSKERASGAREDAEGFGDILIRAKLNLWGNDAGSTALAVMPFVKFPTAGSGLGTGNVEGGLIVPFAVALDEHWSLGLMAEVDLVQSSDGQGLDVELLHTATVGRPIVGELAGFVEYAGVLALEGDGPYRAFFNTGLTYGLTPNVQLDAGVRVGLNRAAEDLGVFAGVSLRY
jgi:hypothetical protein